MRGRWACEPPASGGRRAVSLGVVNLRPCPCPRSAPCATVLPQQLLLLLARREHGPTNRGRLPPWCQGPRSEQSGKALLGLSVAVSVPPSAASESVRTAQRARSAGTGRLTQQARQRTAPRSQRAALRAHAALQRSQVGPTWPGRPADRRAGGHIAALLAVAGAPVGTSPLHSPPVELLARAHAFGCARRAQPNARPTPVAEYHRRGGAPLQPRRVSWAARCLSERGRLTERERCTRSEGVAQSRQLLWWRPCSAYVAASMGSRLAPGALPAAEQFTARPLAHSTLIDSSAPGIRRHSSSHCKSILGGLPSRIFASLDQCPGCSIAYCTVEQPASVAVALAQLAK